MKAYAELDAAIDQLVESLGLHHGLEAQAKVTIKAEARSIIESGQVTIEQAIDRVKSGKRPQVVTWGNK